MMQQRKANIIAIQLQTLLNRAKQTTHTFGQMKLSLDNSHTHTYTVTDCHTLWHAHPVVVASLCWRIFCCHIYISIRNLFARRLFHICSKLSLSVSVWICVLVYVEWPVYLLFVIVVAFVAFVVMVPCLPGRGNEA